MNPVMTTRKRFLSYFSGVGLTTTLLPGTLWAQMQEQEAQEVTAEMIREAGTLSGHELTQEQAEEMAEGVNRNLAGYAALDEFELHNGVAPPLYFSALVPGTEIDRVERPFRVSSPSGLKRPADLEDVAFWPLTGLAELIRTRQVTSVELTEMYLGRLKRYNPKFNNVVTFLDDLAMEEARRADMEIRSGQYRGPLHGIPWGAKDILAVRDYPTSWGSNAFKDRTLDYECTVVRLLREAGAVLIAKLATGELAGGDRWFGGRTRNPWDSTKGSSGSSAGPASATVAGCVGFAIGTETSGSILSPSVACGASGLRPTYGRVSRFGAMTLRWTGDRLGPICRHVEDCAIVFKTIARPDDQDASVLDVPFNWDVELDVSQFRVAYFKDAFEDDENKEADWLANDQQSLAQLRSMGFALTAMNVPLRDFSMDGLRPLGVESSAAFDDFLRSGREDELGRPRGTGWRVGHTVPAVAYLRAQQVRGVMMRRLDEGLGDFDVWVVPYGDARARLAEPPPDGGGGGGGGGGAPPRRSATSQFFQLANHACLPAVAVRNGFGDDGLPTGIIFVGKPFSETKVLSLAKAYQDASGFHMRVPDLEA